MKKLAIFAIFLCSMLGIVSCANTITAYKSASTPDQYAYVLISQYSATLDQAAALIQSGKLTDTQVAALQKATTIATAAIYALNTARLAYDATQNDANLATLQAALSSAVQTVSDVIAIIHANSGSST